MPSKLETWMPWYIADYLADTTHLSTVEHGAYDLLLMTGWKRGGELPDDDKQLAAITKLPLRQWLAIRETIAAFYTVADSVWRQKRQGIELAKAKQVSNVRQEAGKRGGKAKANATANERQNPTQSQSHSQEPTVPSSRSQARGARLASDWTLPQNWTPFALANGFTVETAIRESEKFRDYWHAATGQRATSMDWQKSWQNWIRKAADYARKPTAGPAVKRTESGDRAAILEGLGLAQGVATPRDAAGDQDARVGAVDLGPGDFARAS